MGLLKPYFFRQNRCTYFLNSSSLTPANEAKGKVTVQLTNLEAWVKVKGGELVKMWDTPMKRTDASVSREIVDIIGADGPDLKDVCYFMVNVYVEHLTISEQKAKELKLCTDSNNDGILQPGECVTNDHNMDHDKIYDPSASPVTVFNYVVTWQKSGDENQKEKDALGNIGNY